MTEQDIREWLRMLGKTRRQQARVIRDLLRHANEDRMSKEDRTICMLALPGLDAESDYAE